LGQSLVVASTSTAPVCLVDKHLSSKAIHCLLPLEEISPTSNRNCLDNLFSKIQRDFSDRLDKTVESIKIIANCWDYEQELLLQVKSNETQHILANCWDYEQKLLLQSQIVEIK